MINDLPLDMMESLDMMVKLVQVSMEVEHKNDTHMAMVVNKMVETSALESMEVVANLKVMGIRGNRLQSISKVESIAVNVYRSMLQSN